MCCCAKTIIKYVLFLFNFLFFLAGIALIVMGGFALGSLNEVFGQPAFPEVIGTIPIVTIVIGAVVFIIAFFGCCGAIKENKCFLYMYSTFMLILIAIKIWIASVIFSNLNDMGTITSGWINDVFNDAPQEFSAIEQAFLCCGTTGANSYVSIGRPISNTCCIFPTCTDSNSFDGCVDLATDFFNIFGSIVGSVIIVIICVEVVAIVFAIFIAIYPKKSKNVY